MPSARPADDDPASACRVNARYGDDLIDHLLTAGAAACCLDVGQRQLATDWLGLTMTTMSISGSSFCCFCMRGW